MVNKPSIKFYSSGFPWSREDYYKAENHWCFSGGRYNSFKSVYCGYHYYLDGCDKVLNNIRRAIV